MKHHFLRRTGALLLALVLAFSLVTVASAEDDDNDSTTQPPQSVAVTGVNLNAYTVTLNLSNRTTYQLVASAVPSNATITDVMWATSNADVADVDQDGKVTAYGEGTAIITATSNSDNTKKAECTVTVTVDHVTSVIITPTGTQNLNPNDTVTLKATVVPDHADNKTVTWWSSNPTVATVSEDGEVTAITTGSATIYAEADGVRGSCSVLVTVPVTGVTLTGESEMGVGETQQLTVAVNPSGASQSVTWKSSKPEFATVSTSGLVTGVKAGTTTITATSTADPTKSATLEIEVKNIDVTGIKIDQGDFELAKGSYKQLTATVSPNNATDKTVTWSVTESNAASTNTDENGTVVTIDSASGFVNAVGPGTATITAKAGEKETTCTVTVPVVRVSTVSLNVNPRSINLSIDDKGNADKQALVATVLPDNAADKTVTWTSDDEGIATVTGSGTDNTTGTVTAVKPGTTTITATADGKSITCRVIVTATVAVEKVTIDQTELKLEVGDSGTLKATVTPEGATNRTVTWESSNPQVASVATDGTVTARGAGTAKITATAGGVKSGECTVTVTPKPVINVEKVTLNKTELTLPLGSLETLEATIEPANATNQSVKWTSSNSKIVRVTSTSGMLTPVAKGEATITVTTQDGEHTAECKVTVTDPLPADVTGVTLNQRTARFDALTGTVTLTATVAPDNAKDKTVVWTSSDEAVATVDDKGVVKPVGPGEATITVTSTVDSSKSAECTVTVSGIRIFTSDGTRITADTEPVDLTLNKSMELSYKAYGAAEGASITWSSTDNSIVYMVNGRINGRAVGTASVSASTADKSYTSPALSVRVSESTANIITGNVDAGVAYDFASILANLNNVCREMTTEGNDLKYITNLSVLPEQGVLYYNYVSSGDTGSGVGGTERYYYAETTGERSLSAITFVPKSTYNGTATITYTGYSTNNETYSGIIRLTVKGLDDVTYETQKETAVTFEAADFNNICKIRTGRELSYITLDLPLSTRGTLYYSYTGQAVYTEKVTTGTQYYRTRTPYIEEIAFVPAEGYTGTVQFNYRAVDTSGGAYSGRVTINVTDRGSTSVGDVVYQASQGARVTFKASDFNTACQNAIGETLNYVRFELPSSEQGTLYYKYTNSTSYDSKVTASTRYYRTGTTNPISSVSFVPASNTLGNVPIKFTAYGAGGNRYEGTVTIQYPGADQSGQIPYTTRSGVAAQFDAADFNEVCQDVTGKNLNYVLFDDLPASSRGTLYYNYTTSNNGSRVATNTRCYRSGTPSLSRVAFIPSSSYTGTVEIGFTATDESGSTFKGTVVITVEEGNQTVKMNVRSGGSESFSVSDFNQACQDVTGSTLNYVRFDLPSSSRGTLQYRYGQSNASKVSSSTNYYRTGSNRLLEDVSFVAAASFDGVVEFEYTGYGTNGQQFTGKVEITVYVPTASAIRYTGDSLPVSLLASDFDLATSQALTEALSYVQFTSLPSSAAGQLYAGYNGYNTGTSVTSTTRYYYDGTPSLNQLTFVPRAGYTGTATIGYTAVDTSGNRATGTVTLSISTSTSSHFTDMSNYSWAAPSVEFLYQSGVVNGINNTQFGPGQSILRRDFVVILCRAFGFDTGNTSSFSDIPANSYYAQAVATAKDLGIVTGNNGLFMPDSALSRQDAMVMLQRAMAAAGKTMPSSASLSAYSDSDQISNYARSAVGSMVALGLVQGNNAGQLTPLNPVSRAEMAVIMHRLMTQ